MDVHRGRVARHRVAVPVRRAADLNPAWWVSLVVIVGTALFMLGGMTAVIRSRFSTPTIGREGMVGEDGRAEVRWRPTASWCIEGARWRARTNRATPIDAGDPVRVVAVEGLVLEVEPEEGGAQDYRERERPEERQDGSARRRRRLTEPSCARRRDAE